MLVSSRTIEFLVPDVMPARWLEVLTRVWNESVFILRWREHQRLLDRLPSPTDQPRLEVRLRRAGETWEHYQPLEIQRRIDRTKSWDADNLETISVFDLPQDRAPWVNPKWLEECPISIEGKDQVGPIDLRKPFAKKRCEWLAESDIPQVYVNDFIELVVCASWNAYASHQRGKPRYKKPGELVETIPCASFRKECRYLGLDKLKLPGLSDLHVRGLDRVVMRPIREMIEAMQTTPEAFPVIQQKFEDYAIKDRSKLLKADGIDLSKLRKDKSKTTEEIDQLLNEYAAKVDRSEYMAKAIEYFSSPGAFRLTKREGKTYLQVSAFMPTKETHSDKSIGVDTGLALLVDATNGLRVKHQDFSKEEKRLINLDRAISRCIKDSNAWHKLMAKKRKFEGRLKRSKKAYQAFYAAQIADVNGSIAVKRITIKDKTGLPIPRPDGKGEYLPNGATEARAKNKIIHDCSIGQFVLLLKQQAKKHGRAIEEIAVEAEATAAEVLEVSNLSPVSAPSESSPSSHANDETVGSNAREGGKRKRLPKQPSNNKKQVPEFVSPAETPEPLTFKPRNRKRERRIG